MSAPLEERSVPDIVVVPPGPKSREILERQRGVFYPGLTEELAPFVLHRKHGYAAEDVDDNVYLDMASASGSVPLGACRSDLMEPAIQALRRYGNEDSHALPSEFMLPLAERLLGIAPRSLTRVDIALNGTEAVEIALKFMRRTTGRQLVVGFFGQYHGESTTTATLGAERRDISRGLRQLSPGFVHVPYPNPYRSPFGAPRAGGTGDATVDYIRDHLLFHAVDPEDVAGVIIEPVVGSGGTLVPPDAFWPALTELCREFGWLLCADEVKSGFGRTGRMFAVEHWNVEPDLMCLGKALGGGVLPIGAVLGSERAIGVFDDVPTGSTWAWLPAACAAALETIDAFERDDVLANVGRIERAALEDLGALKERYDCIGDVRVKGAYLSVEFVKDRTTKERAPELQDAVAHACLERGLLADSSTTSYNLQPSLLMPVEALRRGIGILDEAIASVPG
ncbi:MAG: aminotransferase class III-fold pyridoxal phosphate-dependent enzyme [Actinomycetota bacterium]|nr:aminotransferase class III-fold pyridoxal phosphate-dependent enzyme [Actinomycetota bacterium]